MSEEIDILHLPTTIPSHRIPKLGPTPSLRPGLHGLSRFVSATSLSRTPPSTTFPEVCYLRGVISGIPGHLSYPIPQSLWETKIRGSMAGSRPQTRCSSDTGWCSLAHRSTFLAVIQFETHSDPKTGILTLIFSRGAGTWLPSSTWSPCPWDLWEHPWEKPWCGLPPGVSDGTDIPQTPPPTPG